MDREELVTVIVAAYNAEKTIDETLHSVRAQSYRQLEILVVDDGSTDATRKIVEEHVKADTRVHLICQENGGVAAARNRGITVAKGEYIAPIDADDLWCPTKIDKQMKAMRDRGPKVGLIYTWFTVIDEKGQIVFKVQPSDEGQVLAQMCLGNLPGNASSALMRRNVAIEAGGYDTSLRSRNGQGCEDWKLYFGIAESYEFVAIKEFLTHYRVATGNMSADVLQMLRSHDLVLSDFRKAHPECASQFHESRNRILKWLIRRALSNANLTDAVILMLRLFENDYRSALSFLLNGLVHFPLRFLSKERRARVSSTFTKAKSPDVAEKHSDGPSCIVPIVVQTSEKAGCKTH